MTRQSAGYNHVNSYFVYPLNPFPNKPWSLRVCSISLLKTLWGKRKIGCDGQFLLFPQCFQPFQNYSLKIILYKLFQFESLKFVVWERLVALGFNATLTAKVISWRSVTHMSFLAFSHQYQHNFSFQSHRILFSHASAEVRGENTPQRKVSSTGDRTHNHLVMSPTRSPVSHPCGAVWESVNAQNVQT